LMGMD